MREDKHLNIARELEKLYKPTVTKVSDGLGEDNSGQYLTRPEILKDILRPDFLEGTIYERCKHIDVSDKANGLFLVRAKQSLRTILGGILGGFKAYHLDEGTTETPTYPQIDQVTLPLHQIGIACYITNALRQDSLVVSQYLSDGLEETLRYQLDWEILYGDGTGANGILNTGSNVTKFVSLNNPFTVQNIKDMVKWYYGGVNGCWVMSRDAWFEIENLYQNTFPLRFYKDGSITLFGYKVIVKDTQHSRSIVLGDFSQYCIAQKPIREDISEHLAFLKAESVFRAIYRLNGMPIWYSPITEESGQVTWPFVATAGDSLVSSSSSSSKSSESSSSSSNSSSSSKSSDSSGSSLSSQSLSSQSLSSDSSGSSGSSLSSQSLSSQSSESSDSSSKSSDSSDSSESSNSSQSPGT